MMKIKTAIIGAGLTGLACALTLQKKRQDFLLIEAQAQVGGRVQSLHKNGFVLDRGFQIFLEAYPEAQAFLDYDALDLQRFYPGAQIMNDTQKILIGDPLRQPKDALQTALAEIGSLEDKARVLALVADLKAHSLQKLWQRPELPTHQKLRQWGFSERFIHTFWRPFLGGVFLDPDLNTSSHLFSFLVKMFSSGAAAVPRRGMQAIPDQMASHIDPAQLLLSSPLQSITRLSSGFQLQVLKEGEPLLIEAQEVVVATDAANALALLKPHSPLPPKQFWASRTLYFDAPASPLELPVLLLNGQGEGPINHLAVMSDVSSAYAPENRALVSVSVLAPHLETPTQTLYTQVQKQLQHWFAQPCDWELISDIYLPQSLPKQLPPLLSRPSRTRCVEPRLYCGGDHSETGSINGALKAGRLLAEEVLKNA